nr:hypothetical protein BSM_16910 [uncultured archaeon]
MVWFILRGCLARGCYLIKFFRFSLYLHYTHANTNSINFLSLCKNKKPFSQLISYPLPFSPSALFRVKAGSKVNH